MAKVSCTLWSVMRMPMFLFLSWATMRWMSSTATGSTPAKGSSNKINFGSVANARAISVRRRSPPERRSPRFLRICPSPNSSIKDSIFICCSFLLNLVNWSTLRMFCSMLNLRNTEASCAKYPIPFWALLYMGNWVISISSKKICPPLGFIRPTIM